MSTTSTSFNIFWFHSYLEMKVLQFFPLFFFFLLSNNNCKWTYYFLRCYMCSVKKKKKKKRRVQRKGYCLTFQLLITVCRILKTIHLQWFFSLYFLFYSILSILCNFKVLHSDRFWFLLSIFFLFKTFFAIVLVFRWINLEKTRNFYYCCYTSFPMLYSIWLSLICKKKKKKEI